MKVVVARLPSESVVVIVLVPEGCSGTRKVAEKVPLVLDKVVVMVREVPKEMAIWLLLANEEL